jgi:hypothetical protein
MREEAHLVFANEAAIQRALTGNPDFIALCHWNAHIDNAWFHRDATGALQCGLIDWGRVGRLTFGSILWGGLSAAHHGIWEEHLGELLDLFAEEYHTAGGPAVTGAQMMRHLTLHMAAMGISRVLAFPEVIRFRLPAALTASGPEDAIFETSDPARNSLHIYTNFLIFWHRHSFAEAIAGLPASPRYP